MEKKPVRVNQSCRKFRVIVVAAGNKNTTVVSETGSELISPAESLIRSLQNLIQKIISLILFMVHTTEFENNKQNKQTKFR